MAECIFNNLIADLLSRGYSVRFQGKGKSMHPTIQEGEVIEVAPVEPPQVKQGDIILYRNHRGLIAHRVVAIDLLSSSLRPQSSSLSPHYSFILRGDSSVSCDKAVAPQQILGKVVSVERGGRRVDLGSKGAKMLYKARLWTSRLRRAVRYRGWMIEDRGWRSSILDLRSSSLSSACRRGLNAIRFLLLVGSLLFLFWPAQAQAQGINFDAASSSSVTGSTTLTFSHTVGAGGSDRMLIVGVSIARDATTVSSVTYAGASLTVVGTVSNSGRARVEIWRLVAPATGANNVVVTVAAGEDFEAGAASFTGVHQTTPTGTFFSATGNDTAPTVNVTGVNEGEAVIDTVDARCSCTATVGGGQSQRWNVVDGSTGAGSTEPGPDGGGTVTMSWSTDVSDRWAIGAVALKPANPTAVRLMSFRANAYDDGVLLRWRTGYEVDNLGFNVYREEGGNLIRVTPSLVAGSALLAAGRTALTAGRSYSWWDDSILDPQSSILNPRFSSVRYWLEDVDLNGKRTWHGPVEVQRSAVGDQLAAWEQGMLLSRMGRSGVRGQEPGARSPRSSILDPQSSSLSPQSSELDPHHWLERRAKLSDADAARQQVQWSLAAGRAVKLFVRKEGWYRIGQPELVAAGLNPRVDPRFLQLFVDGEEQPMIVTGENDRRFDPKDAIEFYGIGLDTPATDRRVYWLVVGHQPGKRIQVAQARGQGTRDGGQSFPFTVERKERVIYFAALKNGDVENFFGPLISTEPVEQALSVHHLAPVGQARLEVALQGVTGVTHRVRVLLNGVDVGVVVVNGRARQVTEIPVSHASLSNGENIVTLVAQGDEIDVSLIDFIRLTYMHSYTADDDILRFSVPANRPVTVEGFSSRGIRVMDITDPEAVQEVEGRVTAQGRGFAITLQAPGSGERTLLAFTETKAKRPEGVIANQPSAWHRAGQRGDYIIIAHREFLQSVEPLRALRSGTLIDVEDLYDEFSFGAKSPGALRDFLHRARDHWQRPPRFVLLVGDASVDPRNYLGFGDFDCVPTKLVETFFLETASDDWFADFNGDGLPEMAVGRLPARTEAEAATMVSKIIGYEQSGGAWRSELLLVADNNDIFDFEAASEKLQDLIPASKRVHEVFRGRTDVETARREILDKINRGQLIVNYMGHGSVEVWAGEGLLTSADARGLSNGERLPFFVSMTCLNGLFHDVFTESLAEALMKAENGGSIAVWAPSGATVPGQQEVMNQELFRLLFTGKSLTIGEAIVRAKAAASDSDVRRTWILFGDPATRIR